MLSLLEEFKTLNMKVLVTTAIMMMSFVLKAQIIFQVTQSPNNSALLGVYESEWADPANTNWTLTPDMNNSANAIEAELVFVDDDTDDGVIDANGNPTNEDACETVTNDLTGKIAVCYRSFCWHDIKVYNAQQAGAIGVIIINRDPGTFPMGGTTYPDDITIPAIAIGSEEGDLLKNEIANGGVVAFIGTKVGLHPNDMATSKSDIVIAENFSTPIALAYDSSEFNLDLGFWAYNYGANAQTGVTGSVNIDYMGNSVYQNTSVPVNFNAPNGNELDTQYIDLGNFGKMWQTGTYTITYNLSSDSIDSDMADNSFSMDFKITNDNTYSKARTDATGEPENPTGMYLWEGVTAYDDYEVCVQFKDENASRLKAMGMNFSCRPVGLTMANEIVEIRAYEWNDSFTDANDANFPAPASVWTLNQIGSALHFYQDESQNGENIYLDFDEGGLSMNDNQRYLFCVYTASDSLKVGFDNKIDYSSTVNNYLEYSSPVKTLEQGGTPQWFAAGFGFDLSTAVSVNFDETPVGISEEMEESLVAYPNPVANMLSIPMRNKHKGAVNIQVMDLTGKIVLVNNLIGEKLQVNVAGLTNGTYMFKLSFEDGKEDNFKIVVNR